MTTSLAVLCALLVGVVCVVVAQDDTLDKKAVGVMRFGKRADADAEDADEDFYAFVDDDVDVAEALDRQMRASPGVMRFGKRASPGVMRFGKRAIDEEEMDFDRSARAPGVLRFGKRASPGVMRFGKRASPGVMRFGKRASPGVMRFGKRASPGVMRFGKRASPGVMRFG